MIAVPASAADHRPHWRSVEISRVQYDSPGWDNRSNRSLNQEWVEITNNTRRSVNLEGWTLADEDGHTYTFDHYRLAGRATVRVHTGIGHDTRPTRTAAPTCGTTAPTPRPCATTTTVSLTTLPGAATTTAARGTGAERCGARASGCGSKDDERGAGAGGLQPAPLQLLVRCALVDHQSCIQRARAAGPVAVGSRCGRRGVSDVVQQLD